MKKYYDDDDVCKYDNQFRVIYGKYRQTLTREPSKMHTFRENCRRHNTMLFLINVIMTTKDRTYQSIHLLIDCTTLFQRTVWTKLT
jgi:hypothetical protein